MNHPWSTDEARSTYAIQHWSEGYFDVGDDGGLLVKPRGADGAASVRSSSAKPAAWP